MFPKSHVPAPLRLFVLAALLAAFVPTAKAGDADCKPKIDKNTVIVELGVPGLNDGRKVALSFPVNKKEALTGGTAAAHHASPGRAVAADVRYSLHVVERRSDGALLHLVVVTKPANGPERTLTRSVYVRHNEVVEQLFMGGVSLRASFKLLPFKCKKA